MMASRPPVKPPDVFGSNNDGSSAGPPVNTPDHLIR